LYEDPLFGSDFGPAAEVFSDVVKRAVEIGMGGINHRTDALFIWGRGDQQSRSEEDGAQRSSSLTPDSASKGLCFVQYLLNRRVRAG
jgi:hypothetical protein